MRDSNWLTGGLLVVGLGAAVVWGCGDSGPGSDGSAGAASDTGGQTSGGSGSGGAAASGGAVATGGSASGGATGGTSGEPRADGYSLVWSDEFDGPDIDGSKWEHEVNCWGGGNNEQQCYVTDAKNSYIQDGKLHIVALKDSPSGAIGGPGNDPTVVTREYSSARLRTAGKADFKYGRFEARIQLPFGQGLWPAFWMLPTAGVYGGWAKSGEIDIMEAVNASAANNLVYGTLHYHDAWPNNVHTGDSYEPPAFVGSTFYTYAVEWQSGEIRWFVDDVEYEVQNDWDSVGSPFPAPFDQEFHLLLNVAVGGAWPGSADGTTTFPQEMIVDYVRVYQCAAAPDTGVGCGTSDPSVTPL